MSARIWRKHKKAGIVTGLAAAVILLAVYIHAVFRPGLWHDEAFLFRKEDGSFEGSGPYADYRMEIQRTDHGAEVSFSVNELVKQYEIIEDEDSREVTIYEDGSRVFHGTINTIGDRYVLVKEDGDWLDMIRMRAKYVTPSPEELFPSLTQIYNWACMEKCDIYGNPAMVLSVLLLSALLAVDIIFPDFFFRLNCGLWVEGGRPTEWYRAGQIIKRGLAGFGIFICLLKSFTGH